MKLPTSHTTSSKLIPSQISHKSTQCLNAILRTLKIQLLGPIIKAGALREGKKVALYRNRSIALSHTLLHLLPLGATLTLIVLNLRSTYVGDLQVNALNALQFAAKLLEVLVQASIAATTLAVIRHYILETDDLPFGGLVAAYRTTDVSFLWSIEFWGCMTTPALKLKTRMVLCLVLPTAILLAALVGPSNAVLMIPRPMSRVESEQLWFLDQTSHIYPAVIQLESNGTLREESMFNQTYYRAIHGLSIPVVDGSGFRNLKRLGERHSVDEPHSASRDLATVPTILSTELSGFYPTGLGNIYSALTKQPFVYTDCWSYRLGVVEDPSNLYIDFGSDKLYLRDFLSLSTVFPDVRSVSDNDPVAFYQYDFVSPFVIGETLSTVWSNLPSGQSNNSLLMAHALINHTNTETYHGWTDVRITACTIDAYWATVPTNVSLGFIHESELPSTKEETIAAVLARLEDKTLIELTPEWAKAVLASASKRTTTIEALYTLLSLTEVPYVLALSYVPPWRTYLSGWNHQSSRKLSGKNMPRSTSSISDQLYNVLLHYMNTLKLPDQYNVMMVANGSNWTDPATLAQIRITSQLLGYGYDVSSITVKLASAVLLFYLATTVAFLVYSVSTGYAATSWDSIAELVALALNSERPTGLTNTSAGINSLETFRRRVNVRANQHGSLELVFNTSSQGSTYQQVVVNKAY